MRKSVNSSSLHSKSDSVAILCISGDPILSSFLPIPKGWLLNKGLTAFPSFASSVGLEQKESSLHALPHKEKKNIKKIHAVIATLDT